MKQLSALRSRATMNLTKNEKKTLKMLLNNARIPDSEIAEELGISSQAIGKIRKKLEGTIIEGYYTKLNYGKLGIKTFALVRAMLTKEGKELGELQVEQKLLDSPYVIDVYRLPQQISTHFILLAFHDLGEMDDFFHSDRIRKDMHNLIETHEVYTFSHHSIIKDNPAQLILKAIDDLGTKQETHAFTEIERFKKRI